MSTLRFEQEFTRKQPRYTCILRYMREALDVKEVSWDMLTTRNLDAVMDYMSDNVAGNSLVTYAAVLKGFLNLFTEEGIVPCKDVKKVLKAKHVPSEQVVLTIDEIRRIENYMPLNDRERRVKAQFLCEYYCLARASDIRNMNEDNISDGRISYVSQKTETSTSVPLHQNFMKYFEQRGEPLDLSTYNRIIKRICQRCLINEPVKMYYHGKTQTRPKYEYIGSHTARRSGATELARRGTPIPVISKLMNHGHNIQTTQRYIFVDTRNLCDEAMSFFNGR